MPEIYLKEEAYQIVGICMEIHRILGHGFLEIVYKDAIQYELTRREIEYVREKEYQIHYKDSILTHRFYADFVILESIILEVKATENGLCNEFVSRVINYLKASGCKVGLLINFGRSKLEYKRLVF
ncbi:MAG TPA: GxxExxY protein [Flavitalea sp.]|nr:GxxExxY protein [Flavitalea sp.]